MSMHPNAAVLALAGMRHYRYAKFPAYRLVTIDITPLMESHRHRAICAMGFSADGWTCSTVFGSIFVRDHCIELAWEKTTETQWELLDIAEALEWLSLGEVPQWS